MLKIVCIGGGTGLYTLLRGLKKFPCELTSVVSMADDGGSTGILRDEYGILPPGDVRRSIIALSDSTEDLKKVFEFRFKNGSLKNHSLGNLIITALSEIEGSSIAGLKKACKLLNIKGIVLPSTLNNVRLCAELEDGQIIRGETNIDIPKHNPNLKIKKVFLVPEAEVFRESEKAIKEADIIIIGPGDLYTSIIPNLLVKGLPEAIRNSKAKVIYVCNIMTKHGETDNFTVSDFVLEIKKYLGIYPDYVLYNNMEIEDKKLLENYAKEFAFPVKLKNKIKGINFMGFDFTGNPVLLRHDSEKLAKAIIKLGILESLNSQEARAKTKYN